MNNSPVKQQLLDILNLKDRCLPITDTFIDFQTSDVVAKHLNRMAADRGFGSYRVITDELPENDQIEFFQDALSEYDRLDILIDPSLNQ